MFKFNVVFYYPGDDGSHPFGDFKLLHDTPEAAFAYAEAEVQREWEESRDRARQQSWYTTDADWESRAERNIFVVEVRRV